MKRFMVNHRPEILLDCADYVIPDCKQALEGTLEGMRLGVKDLFHIAGLPTTAGNPHWAKTHEIPNQTSSVVKAVIEQGARLSAKTLTDEIAYSLNGVNSHYGTPINPADPSRIPGGSSSGSAVAVANGTVDIGLGTDTGGSIRVPASYNGLYGFRPSHGVVAVDNLVGLAPGFDTVGWLTRDFDTLYKMADRLLPKQAHHGITRLVVVVPESLPNWNTMVELIIPTLESLFANVMESITVKALAEQTCSKASSAFRILQGRQIWREHGQWIHTVQPVFAEDIDERIQWCESLTLADESAAQREAQEFIDYWQQECITGPEAAVLLATTPGAAPKLDTSADQITRYRNDLMALTAPAGLTKAPQISLPLMTDQQAPWGVSLIGQSLSDRALLDLARRINRPDLFSLS